MSTPTHVLSGIDHIADYAPLLRGRRLALMTNPTGINHAGQSTIDLLHATTHLTALLACEHGLRGTTQAGDPISDSTDPTTGLPIYSTYSPTGGFPNPLTDTFDTLVFDMQDVGARFYTYLYSLSDAMIACAAHGRSVIVLDRINPLGGTRIGGTLLDEPRFSSFVGRFSLPTRTGFTIGEYALWVRHHLQLDLDLTVIPLLGWNRALHLPDTDLPWPAPSPNCRTYRAALAYLGTCPIEGTNLSEGRGTPHPFELVGAPWIDAPALASHLNALNLPGIHYTPTSFTPTFSKFANELCHGIHLHITHEPSADIPLAGLHILHAIHTLYPNSFQFLPTPHLNHLLGTDTYRNTLPNPTDFLDSYHPALTSFLESRHPFLLYP